MGARQQFNIKRYNWDVIIYYTVGDDQKAAVLQTVESMGCSKERFESMKENIEKCAVDTGFTYSNYHQQKSVLVIHKASSIGEFLNTFEHEKNHLEMHICEALDINPYSEEAAILSGELAQQIVEEALCSIAEL